MITITVIGPSGPEPTDRMMTIGVYSNYTLALADLQLISEVMHPEDEADRESWIQACEASVNHVFDHGRGVELCNRRPDDPRTVQQLAAIATETLLFKEDHEDTGDNRYGWTPERGSVGADVS